MILRFLDILLIRYEIFQKFIRRKELSVNKDGLSKYYSAIFFVLGTPLIVGAIIGLINTETSDLVYIWLFLSVAALGIIGILYCNLTSRFIEYTENTKETTVQD